MERRTPPNRRPRTPVRTASRNALTTFLGVDVGTLSARAGVFDEDGHLISSASSPIQIWKEAGCAEQSSTDIWHAICSAVHAACRLGGVRGEDVRGIGFDATCSLVALGSDNEPVTVSYSGDTRRNVIVWMDHRAVPQADRINASDSPVLQFVGGHISPEMQPPKLLWVKENLRDSWALAFRWMDLGDWITFRATGDDTRSLCTTVCKWTYLGHAHAAQLTQEKTSAMDAIGWDDLFWQEIGLGELVEGGYSKIGHSVALPGHPLGEGLSFEAAQELGLLPGTPVSSAVIDAHAGGLGTIEGVPRNLRPARSLDPALSRPPVSSSNEAASSLEGETGRGGLNEEAEGRGGEVGTGRERDSTARGREGAAQGDGNAAEGGFGRSERRQGSTGGEVVWDAEEERGQKGGGRGEQDEEIGVEPNGEDPIFQRMVLVCGTSTCHMAMSQEKIFVPGVWGPYWSAMVPGFWLAEGGQSATGALLDHLINGHVAAAQLANQAAASRSSIYEVLGSILERVTAEKSLPFAAALTANLHLLPDFHGNRSPLADPHSRGVMCGLELDTSEEALALLYLATIQGIAYGTRQIIEQCNRHGHQINTLVACGGLAKSRQYLQEHADITCCNIVLPRESEPVLLGAAILGAVAARRYSSVRAAMKAMNAYGLVIRPSEDPHLQRYHEAKFSVFKSLYQHQKQYQQAMAQVMSLGPK